jgi:hypothetical protein
VASSPAPRRPKAPSSPSPSRGEAPAPRPVGHMSAPTRAGHCASGGHGPYQKEGGEEEAGRTARNGCWLCPRATRVAHCMVQKCKVQDDGKVCVARVVHLSRGYMFASLR